MEVTGQLQALADPPNTALVIQCQEAGRTPTALLDPLWNARNPSFFHDSNIRLPGRRLEPVPPELPPGQIYKCKLTIMTKEDI